MLGNEKIYQKIKNTRKGAYIKIIYTKTMESINKEDVIVKTTMAVVRLGINYSNLKSVKADRQNGKQTNGKMKWGQWENGFENYVITHTKDNQTKKYLRVYTTNHHKSKSTYEINGQPTSLEALRENNLIKEKKSNPSPLFVIPFERIIALG